MALAAVAEDGDLAVEEVEVAFAMDRCHEFSLDVVSGGRAGAVGRLRAGPAEPDPPGADELLEAVRADELLERVELLGMADDLEHDRVCPEVGDPRVERLRERDELAAALGAGAATLRSASSRSTASSGSSSLTRRTFTSLCICFSICSSGCCSQSTRSVMRETSCRSVGPTARLSMLKPRRANMLEMRMSAPGLFSTSTESVCLTRRPP